MITRTNSYKCCSKLILVTSHKPTDHMMDLYDGQTFYLKTRVDIWVSMDMVLVEYGTLYQMYHFIIWFFWSVNKINLRWNGVQWWIVAIFVCIGIWT